MELSPTDIRNHHFATQLRGYDKTEVDTFKEQTAQVLEQSKQEQMRLTMELEAIKLQVAGLRQFEDTIKGAAIDARRNADATVATARKEAELILQKAKNEVETLITTRQQRIVESEAQLEKLELTRRAYIQKLRAMITSHLELVEAIISSEAAPKAASPNRRPKAKMILKSPTPPKCDAVAARLSPRRRRESRPNTPRKPTRRATLYPWPLPPLRLPPIWSRHRCTLFEVMKLRADRSIPNLPPHSRNTAA